MSASGKAPAAIDPVVVTGLGIVSAAGNGVAASIEALREGRCGLGRLTRFPSPRCGHLPVGEVKGVAGAPRAVALGSIALEQALEASGVDPAKAGLAVGTTVGGMPESEQAAARLIAGEPMDHSVWLDHECGALAHALAERHGLKGPRTTICNACSSGAEAIAWAAEMLRAREADAMLAGGVDALCRLTLNGFASLLVVDPKGCRPFDMKRAGMSLGEGAAWLVLEREADASSPPLARLAGCGNTCDAYHATAPEPEGRGAEAAMRTALKQAGLDPEDIGYVNAHGTGTPDNDRAEGRALNRLFSGSPPPISSTKRIFGHTLGAAGAIEAVVSVLALTEGLLPGTCGLKDPDPECEVAPLQGAQESHPRAVLSNSFGFGGNNSVLCLTSP